MTGPGHLEPMLPALVPDLGDRVIDLVARANSFASGLHPILRRTVGDLVRAMNCYYSNLIEGHDTHLVDIDRAMRMDYSNEPAKRDLQLEARAHIEVQQLIDSDQMPHPAFSVDGIRWIHAEFCKRLPAALLAIDLPDGGGTIAMEPGVLRDRPVRVGRHDAPEPQSLAALLARFEEAYTAPMIGRVEKTLAIGAAHHRLAWIHPFLDGNGRVTRLTSHARLRELGVGSELWSVSRGLARNVQRYKQLLQAADEPRRGALDGLSTLTEEGLADFVRFFFDVSIDQVSFMEQLLRPVDLRARVENWTDGEIRARRLPKGSFRLLREALTIGEFPRSMATELTGYQERQARTVLSELLARGLLLSDTPKGPVRLGIPAEVTEAWFPGLYVVGRA